MLFDKDVRQICAFCVYAQDFADGTVLCSRRGPVSEHYCCRKFKYDPLRRIPAPPVKVKLPASEDAFRLD